MGWLSSLASGIGSFFGGGGGGGSSGGIDDLLNAGQQNWDSFAPSVSSGGGIADLLNAGQANWDSFLPGGGGGLSAYTPFDPSTVLGQIGTNPGDAAAQVMTNVPGLVNTPALLNSIGGLLNGGGPKLPGGGGAGGGGQQQGGAQQQAVKTAGQLAQGAAGGAGGGSGGSAAGGTNWGSMLAGLLPLFASSQGNTPAYSSELSANAKNSSDLAKMLTTSSMAHMQGQIGGPAMNALEANLKRRQAAIRQNYDAMGMSGSSAETQDLNAAEQDTLSQQYQIGQEMAQTGLNTVTSLTGQASADYEHLMQAQMAADQELQTELARFAGAMATGATQAGGGGGTLLQQIGGLLGKGLQPVTEPFDPMTLQTVIPDTQVTAAPTTAITNVPDLTNLQQLLQGSVFG